MRKGKSRSRFDLRNKQKSEANEKKIFARRDRKRKAEERKTRKKIFLFALRPEKCFSSLSTEESFIKSKSRSRLISRINFSLDWGASGGLGFGEVNIIAWKIDRRQSCKDESELKLNFWTDCASWISSASAYRWVSYITSSAWLWAAGRLERLGASDSPAVLISTRRWS